MTAEIIENQSTGYIKVYRSIGKNWIWEDAEKLKWWLDILLTVNYSDQKVLIGELVIECKRGQSIKSLETWAKRWRTNKSKVRRFFYLLQSDSMIVLENVKKTTRLTVCNYDSYNDARHNSETIVKRFRNDSETIVKPIKEREESKEGKERNAANNIFFELFRRAAGKHITDEELFSEIGKFQNKYPNTHPNTAGALINTWVSNIGRQPAQEKRMHL